MTYIFSSPELKAQVSVSDHNLPVVVVIVSVNFSHFVSFPEPLGQFQPNLAQNIFG